MESTDVITSPTTVEEVVDALHHVLGDDLSAGALTEDTELFGSLPELDSLALVELITVIEERFGFAVEDDDITAETFETVRSLSDYVAERRSAPQV